MLCINSTSDLCENNTIRGCQVSQFYQPTNGGGLSACSAISLNRFGPTTDRIKGIVENCVVTLNGTDTQPAYGAEYAFNATNTRYALFRNNEAHGAQRGFNNDSRPNDYLAILDNRFYMPSGNCYGVYMVDGTTSSRISGNMITLRGQDSSGIVVQGAVPPDTLPSHDILIDNNEFHWIGGSGCDGAYGLNFHSACNTPANIQVEHNTIDTCLRNAIPEGVGRVGNNTGTFGVILCEPSWPFYPYTFPVPYWYGGWEYPALRCDFDQDGKRDLVVQNQAGISGDCA